MPPRAVSLSAGPWELLASAAFLLDGDSYFRGDWHTSPDLPSQANRMLRTTIDALATSKASFVHQMQCTILGPASPKEATLLAPATASTVCRISDSYVV